MRKRHTKVLLIACFLILAQSTASFAVEICGTRVYLHIDAAGGCGAPSATYPGTLCSGGTASLSASDCNAESWLVCCDSTVVTIYQDDVMGSFIVNGAPDGTEAETAESVFSAFSSSTPYKDPVAGFSRVGTFEGYSFTSEAGTAHGTVNVKVSCWKRSLMSRDGTGEVTPIENIGGGGSATVSQGVGEAIDSKFGVPGVGSGAGETGASDAVAGKNLGDAVDGFDTGLIVPAEDSIPVRVQNFLAGNPVFNIFRQSGLDAVASNGACTWNYDYHGRQVQFSLDRHADRFQLLGTFVLILATIYALFISLGRA